MAQKCPNCRSTDVTTGLGNTVSCLRCGTHADHAHVGVIVNTETPAPAKKTPHKPKKATA